MQLPGADQEERYNVVLFHKASRVAFMTLPAKDDCMIRYGHQYAEDEWETDICVTEVISAQEDPPPGMICLTFHFPTTHGSLLWR